MISENLEIIFKVFGKYVFKGKKLGEVILEISGLNGKICEVKYEVCWFFDVFFSLDGEMGGIIWKFILDKLDRIELLIFMEFLN